MSDRRPMVLRVLEEIAWIFLIFVVLTIAVTAVLLSLGIPPEAPEALGLPHERSVRAIALATVFAFSLTLIGYTAVRERRKLLDWFHMTPLRFAAGAVTGFVLVIVAFVYVTVVTFLGAPPPDVAEYLDRLLPFPLLVLAAIVLAPIGEELYFRGRIIDALDGPLGPWGAATFSALMFALMHGIPVLLPVFFVFGLTLVILRRVTGGLAAPIVAHLVFNVIGVLGS